MVELSGTLKRDNQKGSNLRPIAIISKDVEIGKYTRVDILEPCIKKDTYVLSCILDYVREFAHNSTKTV
jgi:hypothetical protein